MMSVEADAFKPRIQTPLIISYHDVIISGILSLLCYYLCYNRCYYIPHWLFKKRSRTRAHTRAHRSALSLCQWRPWTRLQIFRGKLLSRPAWTAALGPDTRVFPFLSHFWDDYWRTARCPRAQPFLHARLWAASGRGERADGGAELRPSSAKLQNISANIDLQLVAVCAHVVHMHDFCSIIYLLRSAGGRGGGCFQFINNKMSSAALISSYLLISGFLFNS